eukprot:1146078-Alexandrium_andersonii.AAC.1
MSSVPSTASASGAAAATGGEPSSAPAGGAAASASGAPSSAPAAAVLVPSATWTGSWGGSYG